MEFDIVSLIKDVGFPIAITAWFMLRTEKVINNSTLAMTRMTDLMVQCQSNK